MKKPTMREDHLQRLVVKTIEPLLIAPCRLWHTPNGGYRTPVEAGIFKALGVKPGIADLLFWPVRGVLAGIELKRPGGRGEKDLTDNQREFRDWLASTGGLFACLDNLDDVLDTLFRWGAIQARRF